MKIEAQFDPATFTLTYIVSDEKTKDAIIIDPVLDYDPNGSAISYESVNKAEKYIKDNGLNLVYILETHAHADHLSSSQELKKRFPNAKVAINENIKKVQEAFKPVFNLEGFLTDGSQFDLLLNEKENIKFGDLELQTIFTPGHTPACSTFKINDVIFTGDALFMPDYGTGRCDFPAGSPEELYDSVYNKLYSLPDETRVFVGHDYQPGGRELQWETTIGASKKANIRLTADTSKEQFVQFRKTRDAELRAPRLIFQSVQVNINAGEIPTVEAQTPFLKMPVALPK